MPTKNTADLTDAGMIRRGLIDEFVARFGDKEFVVERRYASGAKDYVEAIDTATGETDWTSDPHQARIFRGEEWVRVWARPEFTLMLPHNLPLKVEAKRKGR